MTPQKPGSTRQGPSQTKQRSAKLTIQLSNDIRKVHGPALVSSRPRLPLRDRDVLDQ